MRPNSGLFTWDAFVTIEHAAWDSEVVEVFFFLPSFYHPPWSE